MSFNKRQIRILINHLMRELKDCEDNSRYEKLWEERRLLKEELQTKIDYDYKNTSNELIKYIPRGI